LSHLDGLQISPPDYITFIMGRVGVVIFFLLSGYLAVNAREERTGIQYLLNRLVRMYPIYWILLIITYMLDFYPKTKISALFINMSLFHRFVGVYGLIRASWMMPIQIVFFISISILGIDFFLCPRKIRNKIIRKNFPCVVMASLSFGAILTGYVRMKTGVNFPTALFLLMSIAYLGFFWKLCDEKRIPITTLLYCLLIFELGLEVSVVCSYTDTILRYLISYNIGLLLFGVLKIKNIDCKWFKKIGNIGFTFFLGAEIPYSVMNKFVDFNASITLNILGCILKFVFAILFAMIITKYVEKPMLNKAKTVEKDIFKGRKR